MQDYAGLSTKLIWDGTDEVRIPSEMGTPKEGQMVGTAGERLTELAGRVCYDSLGSGRASGPYIENILSVGHLSIAEHFTATAQLQGELSPDLLMGLLNRPWTWVSLDDPKSIRITTNIRGVREWDAHSERCSKESKHYPLATAKTVGLILRDLFHPLAPRIIEKPVHDQVWPMMRALRLTDAVLVQPKHNSERWVTVYMVGSRGFCYDAQTDVMTKVGWKSWSDVTMQDEIATLNPTTHELEYQAPTALTREHYSGEMYRLKSSMVDLFVTPNHRLLVQKHDTQAAKRGEEPWQVTTPTEIIGRRVHYKKDAKWVGESPETFTIEDVTMRALVRNQVVGMESSRTVVCTGRTVKALPFARFIGYWLAEGHLDHTKGGGYHTILSQNEGGRCWTGMLECLHEMGFTYAIKTGIGLQRQIRINGGKSLYEFLKPYEGALNKGIPEPLKAWSPAYQRVIIDAWLDGDGSFNPRGSREGNTISKRLADDMQEAALKSGESASIRIVDRRGETGRTLNGAPIRSNHVCYVVSFCATRNTPLVNHNGKKHDSWEHYSGMIYCATVPNGMLYVRRNGKPCWSGNSHELVRHGDWTAISQRSTRYCEESESPWVLHPLVQEFLFNGQLAYDSRIDHLIDTSRQLYRDLVNELVTFVTPRLKDDPYAKTSARKQARGAARGFLGNALETEIIFSASVSQLLHILRMRAANAADAEIRVMACMLLGALKSSRYASEFSHLTLSGASDDLGQCLQDGGAK